MSARVIITGSLGYIGSELLREATVRNLQCLPIDKDYEPKAEGLCLNLGEHEKTVKAVEDFNPDILIHAGTHSALAYRNGFLNACTEDFQALLGILKSLASKSRCRLIYFSSSYVYSGLPKYEVVREDRPLLPSHNFGVAKSFFEQFILKNHPNSVIFRLSSVFGPGQAKHPNTILRFVQECKEKGAITLWGKGARKIQYIFMRNVIQYTFQGFSLEPGVYNLGGDDYSSVADTARVITDFYKGSATLHTDKPEGETLPFLDNTKLKMVSKKNFFTPFSVALTDYLNSLSPKV